MKVNHFQAMALFAFAVSLAFAFLSKKSVRDRANYFLMSFVAFLVVAIALGWLMYPFSR